MIASSYEFSDDPDLPCSLCVVWKWEPGEDPDLAIPWMPDGPVTLLYEGIHPYCAELVGRYQEDVQFRDIPEPDDILAEYLADHSYFPHMDTHSETFYIGFGDKDRIPPLPEEGNCVICGTPVAKFGDDWRHLAGFKDRDGCAEVFPPFG